MRIVGIGVDIIKIKELNVDCVEIHTGRISNLVKLKRNITSNLIE